MWATKTGRGFLTALFTAALVVVAAPLFADQASVDFGSTIRPFTHAASGFLHSMTATVPNNNLIAPLKPQVFRQSPGPEPFTLYSRATDHGADYQFVISDVYNYAQIYNQGGVLPGDGGDWSAWEEICRNFARTALEQNKQVQFEIWNEPNITYYWNRPMTQWKEMWKHGVQAIREVNPNATIIGPSIASYENPYMNMRDFLTYAKANNVLPDILSWHYWGYDTWPWVAGHTFTSEMNDLKAFAAQQNIDISRITINEYLAHFDQYRPGALPLYFDTFERNGVESAVKSCWETCFDNSLDGLITPSGEPRSIWWAYERYARMSGSSVMTVSGTSLDVMAAQDTGVAYALVGRSNASSGAAEVRLQNLNDVPSLLSDGWVHVLAELIVNSETNASAGPTVMIDSDFMTTNGQLLLTLPNFGAYDAYALKLTPANSTGVSRGDFNNNGVVDTADYVVWRNNGHNTAAYQSWRSNYGEMIRVPVIVPEPSALALLGLLYLGACSMRKQR